MSLSTQGNASMPVSIRRVRQPTSAHLMLIAVNTHGLMKPKWMTLLFKTKVNSYSLFYLLDLINTVTDSQFKYKKTDEYCKEVIGLRQDLLPGRYCVQGYHCRSGECKEEKCIGLVKDASCHKDSDCDVGMFCREQTNWPFKTVCTKLKD